MAGGRGGASAEAGQPAKRARKFRDRYRDRHSSCRRTSLPAATRPPRWPEAAKPVDAKSATGDDVAGGYYPRAKGFGERAKLGARKTRRPRPSRRRLHRKRYGLSEAVSRRARAARAMMTPADLSEATRRRTARAVSIAAARQRPYCRLAGRGRAVLRRLSLGLLCCCALPAKRRLAIRLAIA
jgi:hypothetical protein